MALTQVESAVNGAVTPQMEKVAAAEGIPAELVRQRMAQGQIVIPLNNTHRTEVVGIGRGLATKINASIGTSTDIADIGAEVEKRIVVLSEM